MRHLRPLLRWLHLALICVTLLSYLAPFISPKVFWPFAVLGLAYPLLLVLNLLFLLGWLLLKDRYTLFALATILLGWSHLTALIGFGGGKEATAQQLNILSFNTYSLRVWKNPGKLASKEMVKTFFATHKIDVVCLQEYPKQPAHQQRIETALEELGLKYSCQQKNKSLAIFSRFPIKKYKNHYFKNRSNGFQWADIALKTHSIRVFNLHLQSNAVTQTANKLMEEGNLKERSTWRNMRSMIGNYRRAAMLRAGQAETIAQALAKSPHPVALAGDFNEAPNSYVYQVLTQQLNDAFQEAGRGIGVTYAGKLPGLRIDYILTDPRLPVADYHIFPSAFSDHKGVVTTLNVPRVELN
ncbi:MAG: endonuclease/exonuclease/phosphatase family protein [Bacteroidota bacterium]